MLLLICYAKDHSNKGLHWSIFYGGTQGQNALASEFEINVPSKSYVGQFHFLACRGEPTWEGTKLIVNKEYK